jgi:hypothetical protein
MKDLNCAAQISYLAHNPCHASDPTCLWFNLDFNLVKDGPGHCVKLMHLVIHHNPGVTELILHTPFSLCHQTLHQDSRCQQQHKSLIPAHNLWLNSRTCFVMRSHLLVTMTSEITEYSHLVYNALSQSHALTHVDGQRSQEGQLCRHCVQVLCIYCVNEAYGIKVAQAFIHQAWPQAERSNKIDTIYLDISSYICLKCSRASIPCPWIGKSLKHGSPRDFLV